MALAPEDVKSVKPSGGGDYLDGQAWEAAEQANLPGLNRTAVAELVDAGNHLDIAAGLGIAGWVTDPTHPIIIRNGSTSKWNGVEFDFAGGCTMATSQALDILVNANNVRFEGVIFDRVTGANQVRCTPLEAGTAFYQFRDCGFMHRPTGNDTQLEINGGSVGPDGQHLIFNCVFFSEATTGEQIRCFRQVTGLARVINCFFFAPNAPTITASGLLVSDSGATITSQNNYFHPTGTAPAYGGAATINKGANDATSNTEAITAALRNIAYSAANFTAIGTLFPVVANWLPVAGGPFFDTGADESPVVIDDFFRVARPSGLAYDIGPFEEVSAIIPLGEPDMEQAIKTMLIPVPIVVTEDAGPASGLSLPLDAAQIWKQVLTPTGSLRFVRVS